jgi:hypothetical protein
MTLLDYRKVALYYETLLIRHSGLDPESRKNQHNENLWIPASAGMTVLVYRGA